MRWCWPVCALPPALIPGVGVLAVRHLIPASAGWERRLQGRDRVDHPSRTTARRSRLRRRMMGWFSAGTNQRWLHEAQRVTRASPGTPNWSFASGENGRPQRSHAMDATPSAVSLEDSFDNSPLIQQEGCRNHAVNCSIRLAQVIVTVTLGAGLLEHRGHHHPGDGGGGRRRRQGQDRAEPEGRRRPRRESWRRSGAVSR